MQFYIADTFTDSLKRLSNTEQKQAKTTVFDLQTNPSHPSLKFHRLEKVKDPNFWSIRINDDLRCILHKKEETILVCYVDHHDKAYSWAERRRIEIHPRTGSVQIVTIPESMELINPASHSNTDLSTKSLNKKALFANISEEDILALGVPYDWVPKIKAANEDSIFDYLEVLPAEAGEALLDLAYGKKKEKAELQEEATEADPFQHPDSLRRFKLVTNEGELEEALQATWAKWSVFLHPSQKRLVEKTYNGPVRISGSAGTGKTVVALHRALHLANENNERRVLITTFSDVLLASLKQNFRRLASHKPTLGEIVEFQTLEMVAQRLKKKLITNPEILNVKEFEKELIQFWERYKIDSLSKNLVFNEITQILNPWNISSWEDYKKFQRLGRRSRISEEIKKLIWDFYNEFLINCDSKNILSIDSLLFSLGNFLKTESYSIFDAVVVDEAQDLTPAQLYFIFHLTKQKGNLFFVGDLGQRIFQIPFSWKQLGVEIRGRSHTLRINYRTSEQIRKSADRLLDPEISDYDGNKESRLSTFSVFQGPPPEKLLFASSQDEIKANIKWIQDLLKSNVLLGEILIVVRSESEKDRVLELAKSINNELVDLSKNSPHAQKLSLATMHQAKGLEFRVVLVMACDSHILPSSSRLAESTDESELEEIYATERHLLYVACTRARDLLRITGIKPGSEFLRDLG